MNITKIIAKFQKSGYDSLTADELDMLKANVSLLTPSQKSQFEKDEASSDDDSNDSNDDDDSDDDNSDDSATNDSSNNDKDDDKDDEAVDEKAVKDLIRKSIKSELPGAMANIIDKASDKLVGSFMKGVKKQRSRGADKNVETKKQHDSTREFIKALQSKDMAKLKEIHEKTPTFNSTDDSDARGGYLVPEELRAEILRVAEVGYGLARREFMYLPFSGPGNTRKIPTLASGFDAEWVDESTKKAAGNPTFGLVTQTLEKLAKIIPFTEEILEDSAINLTQLIATLFAESVAKQEDLSFFMGTGSPFTGILNNGSVNTVAMTAGTGYSSLDADDLLDMQDATPAGGLAGAKYYLHRHALSIIRKLKDTAGNYIWQAPTADAPGTIWGFPYELSEALPDNTLTGVDKPFILFGNLKTAAIFGDKQQIRTKLLDQATITDGDGTTQLNLAEQDMLALRMEERVGYVLALPDAVTVLTTGSAS